MHELQKTESDITLNGRSLNGHDPRVASLLQLLRCDSRVLGDYVCLLEQMALNGEYRVLAELLLEGECRHALEQGTAMVQGNGEIVVCRDAAKTVLISAARRFCPPANELPASTIEVLANDMCYMVLGQGRVHFDRYEVDACGDSEHRRLRKIGPAAYSQFELFTVAGAREAIQIVGVDGEPWLLQLVLSEHSTLVHTYDQNLQLARTASANFHASRIEFVFDLFKRFGYSDAAGIVERVGSSSRFHFVRWKAVQTMLHLDFSRGLRLLDDALLDPHPHVRRAASRTKESIGRVKHL